MCRKRETSYMQDNNIEINTEKKELKAKKVSLVAKIVGAVIIVVGYGLKVTVVPAIDTNDLLKIGFSVMGIFGAIDLNIALDKFSKK